MANTEKATAAEKTPVQIKTSEVLAMLNNGQDRRAIAKHYGVTLATIKEVFKHPKLAGARVKPRTPVELIDDSPEVETKATKPAAEAGADTAASSNVSESSNAGEQKEAVAQTAGSDKGVW